MVTFDLETETLLASSATATMPSPLADFLVVGALALVYELTRSLASTYVIPLPLLRKEGKTPIENPQIVKNKNLYAL